MHHRVKNNLMTIIGLIKMQETKANNEMFNPLLQELEGRVRSMALVHESLHKSERPGPDRSAKLYRDDGRPYTCPVRSGRDIRFSVQAAGVEVGLDIAVPCGLILNEMIVNAYKHAFPGGKPRSGEGKCEITVAVKHEGDILTIDRGRQRGRAARRTWTWRNPQTLGLKLIKMLSQQINGSLEMDAPFRHGLSSEVSQDRPMTEIRGRRENGVGMSQAKAGNPVLGKDCRQ